MNLLAWTICLPLVGAVLVAVLAGGNRNLARWLAAGVSLATLVLVGGLLAIGPAGIEPWGFAWTSPETTGIEVRFQLGLDGLSMWLFGLAALLTFSSVLVSWEAITEKAPGFYALLLLLETGMLGVFAAQDVILFYLFFEFTLIPLFFLIGIWGSEQRRYAAVKFFLFTFAGSVLTFLGLLAIVIWEAQHSASGVWRFSIPHLTAALSAPGGGIEANWQLWIFLALFAGFAIKVPLFPLHTWLPLAHVQAPTAGSVLLAGILLKLGTYGFLRFSMPLLPEATVTCMPWILWLSVAGIIYGALVALAQSDLKRLIAYSSVSHLGFCMLGLFSLTKLGMQGGALQMINHGLSTGGLFALVGMLYERYHTREIRHLSGLARRTPVLAGFMLVFTFSSIGLPGLNGFVGEFLILTGMFQRAWSEAAPGYEVAWMVIAVLALSGVVLGAWYMLWLVERVFFGPLREPDSAHGDVADLGPREVLALAPLVVFMVWIGLAPQGFLEPMQAPLDRTLATVQRSFTATYGRTSETAGPLLAPPPNESGLARTSGEPSRVD